MRDDRRLSEIAAAQHNMLGWRQARDAGVRSQEWSRMIGGPLWTPVSDRVVRLRGGAPSRGERLAAALLDDDLGASVSHASAVWWWGVPGFRAGLVQLARTAKSNRSTELARVHRVRRLDPAWTTVLDGIRVVRPEVAILQLCGMGDVGKAERALDNAWNLRLLSGPSLVRLLNDYGERGRNGTAVLRELVAARGEGYVPPASNLEARVQSILAGAGIEVRRQVDAGGETWTGRVDFLVLRAPVVIEVQSECYHSALLDRAADCRRIAQLEADGFEVVEVTDVMVWQSPQAVVDRVRQAIRARRAAG
jgi:very-short-patch-repair endonuclease